MEELKKITVKHIDGNLFVYDYKDFDKNSAVYEGIVSIEKWRLPAKFILIRTGLEKLFECDEFLGLKVLVVPSMSRGDCDIEIR